MVRAVIEADAGGKLWKLMVGREPQAVWTRAPSVTSVTSVKYVTSVTSPQVGREPQAIWTGPEYPNSTTAKLPPAEAVFDDCGFEEGCLFELRSDPSEHLNLASSHPEVVSQLRARLATSNATVFAPHRPRSPRACEASLQKYKDPRYSFGWWGPFADDA